MPKTARGPRQALPDRAAAEALPNRIEAPRFMLPVWNDKEALTEVKKDKPAFDDPDGNPILTSALQSVTSNWVRVSELYTSNPELVQVVHQDEAAAAAPVKKEFHGLKLASQHANIVSESILAQLNMVNLLRQHIPAGCFLWEHVFPAQFNPSGRYVVRLFQHNQWRRVIVDDKVPVDSDGKSLLPVSTMENEVWPLIVGKALLKAFSGQPLPCGGVMLFNALTGMFPTSAPSSWLHLLQSTQHQDEAASVGKLPLPLAAFAFTSNAEQAHTFRCVVSGHLPPLLVAVVAESVSPADGEPAPSVVEDKVEDGATVESNVVHPFTSVNLLDNVRLPGDESAILFSFQPPISSAPVQSDQIEPDVESEHFPVHSSNAESTVFLLYPSSACFPVSSHFELLADEKDTYTFSPMSSAPLLVRKTGESLKILVLAQSVESGNSCGPSGLPPKPPASARGQPPVSRAPSTANDPSLNDAPLRVTIELLSVPTETSQTATTTTQTVLTRQAHTDHPSFTCFAFDLPEQKHQSLTELYRFTVESTRGYSLGLAVCAANKFELVSETPAVVENAAEPASEPSSEEHQEADPNADVTQEIKHVFMPSLIPLSQITSFDLSVDPTIAAANALSSTPHALNSVVHLVENTSKTWSELGIVLKESSGMMQSSLVNLCAAMHKVTFKIDSKNGEPAPGGAWVWFSFTQAHSHSHCWLELTGNGVTKKLSHLAAPIWLDTHEQSYTLIVCSHSSAAMPPVKFVLRAFSWSSTHQLSDLVPEPCNVVSEFSGVYTRNVNKIVCREIITSPAAATFSLGCSVDCASSGLILSVSDLDTGDVVVANSTAFGSVFVPHLFLNANQNVLVECRLDPLCVGDWNQNQPASSDENAKPALSWTITLQASVAGLTVSKDFRQIDMFGAIKAEWETSNPGRAEKAKAARAKYLNPPAVDPALEFTINNNTGEQPTQPVVKTAKAPVEVGLNAPVAQLTAELSQQRADALKERAEQSNQEKERAAQRRQAELEYRLDAVAKQWISDAQLNRAALLERRTKENGERAAYLQRFQAFDAAVMQLRAAVMVASKAESIEIAAASLPALQQALAAVYGSAGIVPPSNPADAPAPAVDGGEVPSEPTEPNIETAASMKIDLKHENAEVYVAAAERFVVALKQQEQREKERLEKEEREKAEQPPAEVPKSARGK